MGFNIAGATTTSVLVIIQPIVAELTNNVSNIKVVYNKLSKCTIKT